MTPRAPRVARPPEGGLGPHGRQVRPGDRRHARHRPGDGREARGAGRGRARARPRRRPRRGGARSRPRRVRARRAAGPPPRRPEHAGRRPRPGGRGRARPRAPGRLVANAGRLRARSGARPQTASSSPSPSTWSRRSCWPRALLPALRAAAPARIVILSSASHWTGEIRWDDLQLARPGAYDAPPRLRPVQAGRAHAHPGARPAPARAAASRPSASTPATWPPRCWRPGGRSSPGSRSRTAP